MPPIFFLPQLRYISNDTFLGIAKNLGQFQTVYIDSGLYDHLEKPLEVKEKNEIIKFFDVFERISIHDHNSDILRQNRFVDFRLWIRLISKLVENYKPVAVVLPTDVNFIFRVFKIHFPEITRIVVQPSIRFKTEYSVSWAKMMKYLIYNVFLKVPVERYKPNYGGHCQNTHYLLWGEKWRTSERLKSKSGVYLTGAVKYDNFRYENTSLDSLDIQNRPFFSNSNPIISIFLNKSKVIGLQSFMEFIELYKSFISERTDLNFIVKVHPMEDLELCTSAFEDVVGRNVLIEKDLNSNHILNFSQVMITQWSSVLYDSLFMKTPFVLVNPNSKFDFTTRNLDDYPFIATNAGELTKLVDELSIKENNYQRRIKDFVESSLFKIDNHSGKRSAKAIAGILS